MVKKNKKKNIRFTSNDTTRTSVTIAEENFKKESRKSRIKRLSKYSWGIGLEHEMHLFHKPRLNNKGKITEFIVYDTKQAIEKLIRGDKISLIDKDFLRTIPFEVTGRKCHGKWALPPTPIKMPEFVTDHPFSNLQEGAKTMEYYVEQIRERETNFEYLVYKNKRTEKQMARYGDLRQFPYGMTNYLTYPKGVKYNEERYKLDGTVHTDYLGSYHLTMTLPFTTEMSEKEFLENHKNFANQIQWLEPLLITAFFSSDQRAVGTSEKRIKGSYRVVRVGWGNLAGSDVRKFNEGIGRYSDIKSYWRNGLKYKNVDKTMYCKELAPQLKKIEKGAVSGFSSDFRTFGSTDPLRPDHRDSGVGMTKPNGVELRIFDHFDSGYLLELCRFVVYVAENSRIHKTKKYVYDNKSWIENLQNIMMNGWSAKLSEDYVNELRQQLNLRIRTTSLIAYHVLNVINKELYEKHNEGDYVYLMLNKKYKRAPHLPQINRRSWEMGLMLKLNRNKGDMKRFNKLIMKMKKNNKYSMEEYKNLYFSTFDKQLWSNNLTDVLYFMQTQRIIELKHDKEGNIVEIINKEIYEYDNFNEEIVKEWERPFFIEVYRELVKNIESNNPERMSQLLALSP